jgi:methylenetetrahydrofolate reductase (NADPH)
LTCVGSTAEELRKTLTSYKEAGIGSVLALRGDPQGGPGATWISTPGGFDHADQLVSLAVDMGFEVGVAAFPDLHPASKSIDEDINVLLEKERRGAKFATTQFFFSSDSYVVLTSRLRSAGSNLPVIAGVLPITNVKQLERMALLSGTLIPPLVTERIGRVEADSEAVRREGVALAISLCKELIASAVPGIHFYTMNNSNSTIEIVKEIGLR